MLLHLLITFIILALVTTKTPQTFPLKRTYGRRCRDRMVVGFTTTCAMSAYHH
jgi:hypothetical protein